PADSNLTSSTPAIQAGTRPDLALSHPGGAAALVGTMKRLLGGPALWTRRISQVFRRGKDGLSLPHSISSCFCLRLRPRRGRTGAIARADGPIRHRAGGGGQILLQRQHRKSAIR